MTQRSRKLLEVRALPQIGEGIVVAYASVYGVPYGIGAGRTETIMPGAFRASIAAKAGGSFPIFLEHQWEQGPIGHAQATEDARGLKVRGQLYVDDPQVRRVYRAMKEGALGEWSVGFTYGTEQGDIEYDNGNVIVHRANLVEVSVVVKGANPATHTLEVRRFRQALARAGNLDQRRAAWLLAHMEDEGVRALARIYAANRR